MSDTASAVGYDEIVDAAFRLRSVIHRTPVLTSRQANKATNAQLFFKCENFQRAGTFKFRGAYNALAGLTKAQRRAGILVFSAGNHARAISCAAKMLQIPATVLFPMDADPTKVAHTRACGATIVTYDRSKDHRDTIVDRLARQQGLTLISSFDHPDMIAGYGTAAMELFDEVGPLDYLYVPVMVGGGLAAGATIAAAELSTDCHVVGVEPVAESVIWQQARTTQRLMQPLSRIVHGRGTSAVSTAMTVPIMRAGLEKIVAINDEQWRRQMCFFAETMKIVVEPAGCFAAAGAFDCTFQPGARVGVIVSGGNIDLASLQKVIDAENRAASKIVYFAENNRRSSDRLPA